MKKTVDYYFWLGFFFGVKTAIVLVMVFMMFSCTTKKPCSTVKIIYVDSLPNLGDSAVYVSEGHFPNIQEAQAFVDAGDTIRIATEPWPMDTNDMRVFVKWPLIEGTETRYTPDPTTKTIRMTSKVITEEQWDSMKQARIKIFKQQEKRMLQLAAMANKYDIKEAPLHVWDSLARIEGIN